HVSAALRMARLNCLTFCSRFLFFRHFFCRESCRHLLSYHDLKCLSVISDNYFLMAPAVLAVEGPGYLFQGFELYTSGLKRVHTLRIDLPEHDRAEQVI